MIYVVDASVVVDVLLQAPRAAEIERTLFAPDAVLCAPDLLRLEVLQVLRRWLARGHLSKRRADSAVSDFRSFRIRYYSSDLLLDRCWQLKDNLTIYDGAYLTLAEQLKATLATGDSAFSGITSPARVEVFNA